MTQKKFQHNIIDIPTITRIDGDVRLYETPTGQKYPSVTSVLSGTADKSHLIKWRNRIGHEEAARQTAFAGTRGTNVHKLCESYVLNENIDFRKAMPSNVSMFNQIRVVLDQHVDNVRLSEGQLFSHKLKVAGSVDLVADYKGIPAIVDFKTSKRNKRHEWIIDYFLQASMYSFMLYEMTGLLHTKIVIIIAVDEENQAQVFEEDARNWIDVARARCKLFHQNSVDIFMKNTYEES